MADELRTGQVKLRVHGAQNTNGRVRASVFARQLAALVKALEAADKVTNGGIRFDYVVSDLKSESAAATLTEVVFSKKRRVGSGTEALGHAIKAINDLNRKEIQNYYMCIPYIERIARGVSEDFSHTDIRVGEKHCFRVDDFFLKQVRRAQEFLEPRNKSYYTGVAIGVFDGTIKEADLRGDTPRLKLILRAGGKEIDCIYRGATSQQIKDILDCRVSVEGRAHYGGESGLPERIEILHHREVKAAPDMLRWRGKFKDLTASDWDDPT